MRWECEDSVPGTATARGQPLPKSQLCAAPRLLGHPRELRCGAGQRAGKVALKRSPLKRLEAVEVEKPLDRSRSWRSNHGKHESRHPCCAAHDSGMSSDGMSSERRRGMSSDEGCADGHAENLAHTAEQFLQTSAMRSQWKIHTQKIHASSFRTQRPRTQPPKHARAHIYERRAVSLVTLPTAICVSRLKP